jgi:hypothetical protein
MANEWGTVPDKGKGKAELASEPQPTQDENPFRVLSVELTVPAPGTDEQEAATAQVFALKPNEPFSRLSREKQARTKERTTKQAERLTQQFKHVAEQTDNFTQLAARPAVVPPHQRLRTTAQPSTASPRSRSRSQRSPSPHADTSARDDFDEIHIAARRDNTPSLPANHFALDGRR